MLAFKTLEDRMKHPLAKLIPASMWDDNQLFCNGSSLDTNVLSIMEAQTSEEIKYRLMTCLNDIKKNPCKKKSAWLGIALTQPTNFTLLLETAGVLGFDKNEIFVLFAILGNETHLKSFATQYSKIEVLELIQNHDYCAYWKAAEHGNLGILRVLETQDPKHISDMIKAYTFYAYTHAASNGHMHILKKLEIQAPNLVNAMIMAQSYYAFRYGAANGHLEVLKHLHSKAPLLINKMAEPNDFYAYTRSIKKGHLEVSHWLLSNSSSCLAYAEAHMHEYGKVSVIPFIEQQLAALHRQALATPPPHIFDIPNTEQAAICFYIIRNLIRRNDRTMDDEIKFLLNIPAVKALAHTALTPRQPNELIRLALTTGNQEAASILLNIPEVRILSEENDFYRAEVQGKLDLGRLSKDRESSMTALTKGEQRRLHDAIKRYQPTLKKIGADVIMNSLREQLKERYKKHPASIITQHGNTIGLPMDFAEFQKMKLNKTDYELALKAYYQNKNHTAWRYLSKPNPWMHAEADYVYISKKTDTKWSTFEEYQPLIALLYLATIDKDTPPTEGHTLESRLNHFVDELTLIGRAHNYSKTRTNAKGKEEEYDDLEGDRPSCFSGVKRRLFQSVLGHPLFNILTEDMLLDELRTFARDHFQLFINEKNKAAFKAAFDDYIINTNDMNKSNKGLLTAINIPIQKQEEFESYLSQKYGAQYTEDFAFMKLVRSKLTLSPDKDDIFDNCHALMLDSNVGLYQILTSPTVIKPSNNQNTATLAKIGFLGHKQEATSSFTVNKPSTTTPPKPL